MHKNFFFLIFFLFSLGFSSCSKIPIKSDICDITTEICYYAQSICEQSAKKTTNVLREDQLKYHLRLAVYNLQSLHSELNVLAKNVNDDNIEDLKSELINIRDELKAVYKKNLKDCQ